MFQPVPLFMEHDLDFHRPFKATFSDKSGQFPSFPNRVTDVDKWASRGYLGRMVAAIHAILLKSGFVIPGNGPGSPLPAGWLKAINNTLSVQYTTPHDDAKIATIKYSAMGKFVSVYGFVPSHNCKDPEIYRLCLDATRLAPSVDCFVHEMSKEEAKRLFNLSKIVGEQIAQPLLIDLCENNGLILPPPCFVRLPGDIKMKILELLCGVDIAMVSCVSSEMKELTSNNELWKQKFKETFKLSEGNVVVDQIDWKEKFAIYWSRTKEPWKHWIKACAHYKTQKSLYRRSFIY